MEELNPEFISTWSALYERTERDEPEYRDLISAFRKCRRDFLDVNEGLLRRVIRWKSARISTRIDYGELAAAVSLAAAAPKSGRMAILDAVTFVGPPVASTILHFMYPTMFPIFDVRTAELLHHAGLITSKNTEAHNYPAFTKAIFVINARAPEQSLRQIDRALFSYHKQVLNAGVPKTTTPPQPTSTSTAPSAGARTMTNHDMIAFAVRGARGQQLSRGQIWNLVHRKFPSFSEGSLLPNDHATGNKGACRCAGSSNRIFDRVDLGRYRVR